jgi:hypothetical protein
MLPLLIAGVVAAPTPGSAQVLPPTQTAAEKIVDDYIQANTRNNASLDLAGQDAIEDAPIKTIDDALFQEFRGRGQTTLGEENVTIDDVKVFVPDQSSYPLTFFALQRSTSPAQQGPTRQYLIFVKANELSPWKVSMAAQLLGDVAAPKLERDADGFVSSLTGKAASSLAVKPDSLSRQLAKLWKQSTRGVATSNVFSPGPLTTDAAAVFVGALEQLPLGQAQVDFSFAPAENRATCLATTNGGALCFFVVTFQETLKPTSGTFVQPDTREPLTGHIAPGEYGQVRFDRTAILAAAVPKRGKLARVDVIGLYEGIVRAEAKTAAQTSPAV